MLDMVSQTGRKLAMKSEVLWADIFGGCSVLEGQNHIDNKTRWEVGTGVEAIKFERFSVAQEGSHGIYVLETTGMIANSGYLT